MAAEVAQKDATSSRDMTFKELGQLLRKQWHLPVFGLSTLLGLVSGAIPQPYNWIPIGVGIIAFVVASIASVKIHPTYLELTRMKDQYDQDASDRQANFRVIFGALLTELSNEVGLTKPETRVSGYSHTGEAFVMVGRISDNPKYKVAGRGVYPQDQGLIAEVWEHGYASCVSLPDDIEKYVIKMEKDYALAPDTTRALTMKSRSLVGIRVSDKSGAPVGVVIAESISPRGVTKITLAKIQASEAWKTICHQMVTSRELLPDMLGVSKEGF